MIIDIDASSGFCFGVVTAIRKAEEVLREGGTLYCLGDIVHNSKEVARLTQLGLRCIDHKEFARLRDTTVLLRAHGEPPSTYQIAKTNNIEIIDATCPVVLALQKRIKADATPQIVIFGKRGHAEVLGLVGQTDGQAIVIQQIEEAARLDFTRNIVLYAQTTQSVPEFRRLEEYIRTRIQPPACLEVHNTICRQVSRRIDGIRDFAASHDVILFVSDVKSSNGRVLFQECRTITPHTYLVASKEEFKKLTEEMPELFKGVQSTGICGATSTPVWQLEEIADCLKRHLA